MPKLRFTAAALALFATTAVLAQEAVLSEKMYVDPKGFFTIVPPRGWAINEYSSDPRGKVDFDVTPGPLAAQLKVIGAASPFDTFEAMVADTEGSAGRMRQRFGGSWTVEKISLDGQPAVKMTGGIPGKSKNLVFQTLRGKSYFTLAYAARVDLFDKHYSTVMTSIESFQPTLKVLSKQEAARHIAASRIRLANLHIQLGRKDWALKAIEEGLAADPGNKELLDLKKQVEKMP
jgi:hypothetical protein